MATKTKHSGNGVQSYVPLETERERVDALVFQPAEMVPWPNLNPRTHFDPQKLAELTQSVRDDGVHQPITLHDRGADPTTWYPAVQELPGIEHIRYLVVAGETRWKAATAAGKPLPAVVKHFTYAKALEIALIENMKRNDLTAIEEGVGFRRMVESHPGVTVEQLAETIGVSQEHFSNRMRLTRLPADVTELVNIGRLLPSHARDFFLPFIEIPEAKRKELFKRAKHDLDHKPQRKENEPYRGEEVAEVISRVARDLSKPTAGFDRWTVVFAPGLHAAECKCNGPKFRYAYDGTATVRCFDDEWWQKAQDQARREKKKKVAAKQEKAGKVAGDKGARVLDIRDVRKKYGYEYQPISATDYFDVSMLEGTGFIVAEGHNGKQVFCTDLAKMQKARAAAVEEQTQLVEQARTSRKLADVEVANKHKLTGATVRALLSANLRDTELLKEFGFACTWQNVGEVLAGLTDAQAELIGKVVALRVSRGEYKGHGPFDEPAVVTAVHAMKEKYGAEVTRLRRKVLASSGSKKSQKKLAKAGA